ncbi:MAG TPA: GNAT family N-acetyltransferase [Gemmatales bacterium]|nr:GNAT family N-acetyltransferase [Gemmatales bacterium]HMP60665.1 GNAT family N-acetyltransferase [Gemmatales bacterium]
MLLWHDDRPIGICVFSTPGAALRLRSRFFGLKGRSGALGLQRLNEQLWVLSRVVLHPTYRGAGLAAAFVRQACRTCPVPWIETLSALGHLHPFFERAGFVRVGVIEKHRRVRPDAHAWVYGGRRLSPTTIRKSRHSEPVYYVFDNRR